MCARTNKRMTSPKIARMTLNSSSRLIAPTNERMVSLRRVRVTINSPSRLT